LHLGCYEVFGRKEIRALGDLKGKTVGEAPYGGIPTSGDLTLI
jgi:hypothetical protein